MATPIERALKRLPLEGNRRRSSVLSEPRARVGLHHAPASNPCKTAILSPGTPSDNGCCQPWVAPCLNGFAGRRLETERGSRRGRPAEAAPPQLEGTVP